MRAHVVYFNMCFRSIHNIRAPFCCLQLRKEKTPECVRARSSEFCLRHIHARVFTLDTMTFEKSTCDEVENAKRAIDSWVQPCAKLRNSKAIKNATEIPIVQPSQWVPACAQLSREIRQRVTLEASPSFFWCPHALGFRIFIVWSPPTPRLPSARSPRILTHCSIDDPSQSVDRPPVHPSPALRPPPPPCARRDSVNFNVF